MVMQAAADVRTDRVKGSCRIIFNRQKHSTLELIRCDSALAGIKRVSALQVTLRDLIKRTLLERFCRSVVGVVSIQRGALTSACISPSEFS